MRTRQGSRLWWMSGSAGKGRSGTRLRDGGGCGTNEKRSSRHCGQQRAAYPGGGRCRLERSKNVFCILWMVTLKQAKGLAAVLPSCRSNPSR
jgi:hypothetical protein